MGGRLTLHRVSQPPFLPTNYPPADEKALTPERYGVHLKRVKIVNRGNIVY